MVLEIELGPEYVGQALGTLTYIPNHLSEFFFFFALLAMPFPLVVINCILTRASKHPVCILISIDVLLCDRKTSRHGRYSTGKNCTGVMWLTL